LSRLSREFPVVSSCCTVDWLFLLLLGLGLFFGRDLLLVHSFSGRDAAKITAAYGAIFVTLFSLLGTAADFVSRDQALSLLRDARLWVPAILLHGALWFALVKARRAMRARRWVFALTVLPTPVFVYCAGGLCWMTLASTGASDPTVVGALLGSAWVTLVIAGAWGLRWFGVTAGRSDEILDFAAAANLSAVLLLPLHQQSSQSALLETSVHGETSALALAATAGLIGASFLFHRMRRSP
jgi:hypothetical protein